MNAVPEPLLAEMKERLLVHFAAGAWRVPVSVRAVPGSLGPVVAGGAADVARALRAARVQATQLDAPQPLTIFPAQTARALCDLRRFEGYEDDPLAPHAWRVPDLPPAAVLLSSAQTPVALLVALLAAGARSGLVWKPAPGAAASGHVVMDALGRKAPGALAMVQGDHATGALLAAEGPLIWASPAPVPAGLRPALTLSAKAPRTP
jgi:hypothetical protein